MENRESRWELLGYQVKLLVLMKLVEDGSSVIFEDLSWRAAEADLSPPDWCLATRDSGRFIRVLSVLSSIAPSFWCVDQ